MQTPAAEWTGQVLGERYLLAQYLGGQDNLHLYQGQDSIRQQPVRAIVFKPLLFDKLQRRHVPAGFLRYPLLLGIEAEGESGGHPYLICPWMPEPAWPALQLPMPTWPSLAHFQLDEATVFSAMAQLVLALDFLKRNGITPAHLSPEMLYWDQGLLKLFLPELYFEHADALPYFHHYIHAAADYLAPECIVGKAVTEQSLIYALGMIALRLVVGYNPFQAEQTRFEFTRVEQEFVLLDREGQMSDSMLSLLSRCLAVLPEHRHRDLAEVFREISTYLSEDRFEPVAIPEKVERLGNRLLQQSRQVACQAAWLTQANQETRIYLFLPDGAMSQFKFPLAILQPLIQFLRNQFHLTAPLGWAPGEGLKSLWLADAPVLVLQFAWPPAEEGAPLAPVLELEPATPAPQIREEEQPAPDEPKAAEVPAAEPPTEPSGPLSEEQLPASQPGLSVAATHLLEKYRHLKEAFILLKSRYQALQKAYRQSQAQAAGPEQEVGHLRSANQELQQQVTALRRQIRATEGLEREVLPLQALEARYASLENRLLEQYGGVTEELQSLQQEYQGLQGNLQQQYDLTGQQLSDLAGRYGALWQGLDQQYAQAENQLTGLGQRYGALEQTLDQQQGAQEQILDQLQERYRELSKSLGQQVRQLEHELEHLAGAYTSLPLHLNQQVGQIEQELGQVQHRYQELLSGLSADYGQVFDELTALQERAEQWLEVLLESSLSLQQAHARGQALEAEGLALSRQLQEKHHEIAQVQQALEKTAAERQATEEERQRVETLLGQRCQEVDDLKHEATTLKAHLKHVQHERHRSEAERVQLEARHQLAATEKEAFQEQAQQLQATLTDLESRWADSEQIRQVLQRERRTLEETLQHLIAERDALQERARGLEKELHETQLVRQALKNDKENLESVLQQSLAERQMLKDQLLQQDRQLAEARHHFLRLQELQEQYEKLLQQTDRWQALQEQRTRELEQAELVSLAHQQRVQELEQEQGLNQQEVQRSLDQARELAVQIEALQAARRQHEQERTELEARLEAAHLENGNLWQRLELVRQVHYRLERERNELDDQKGLLEQTLHDFMEELRLQEVALLQLERLTAEGEAAAPLPDARFQDLLAQLTTHQEQETLRFQLEREQTTQRQQADQIKRLEGQLTEAIEQAAHFRQQCETLRTDRQQAQTLRDSLAQEQQGRDEHIHDLQARSEALRQQLLQAQRNETQLQYGRDRLEAERNYFETQWQQTRLQLQSQQDRLRELEARMLARAPGSGPGEAESQYAALLDLIYQGKEWTQQERAMLNFAAQRLELAQSQAEALEQELKQGEPSRLRQLLAEWNGAQSPAQTASTPLQKSPPPGDGEAELQRLMKLAEERQERSRQHLVEELDLMPPALMGHGVPGDTDTEGQAIPGRQLSIGHSFHSAGEVPPADPRTSLTLSLLSKNRVKIPPVPRVAVDSQEPPLPGMVYIPPGEYLIGDDRYSAESPVHLVKIAPFYLDIYPVTNADFIDFMQGGGYHNQDLWTREGWEFLQLHLIEMPAYWNKPGHQCGQEYPEYPVVGLSWYEAVAYAAWAGKRLPTEAEWEAAARGPEGWEWPWDNQWKPNCANTSEMGLMNTSAIGKYPDGKSYAGCYDMVGNVLEWTVSLYKPYPYQPGDGREDLHAEGNRTLRGCSWSYKGIYTRCAYRFFNQPTIRHSDVGFRCARDLG